MDIDTKNIYEIIRADRHIVKALSAINSIEEELYLTGGFVRNRIWNKLHNYSANYEIEDCDIIFFNPFEKNKTYERFIENRLSLICPEFSWSVKNQARMHIKNKHKPYSSIEQALFSFPEKCSAFAINKNWDIISPYGLKSLFELKVTPTSFCEENEINVFYNRLLKKNWLMKWRKLTLDKNCLQSGFAFSGVYARRNFNYLKI